MMKKLLCAALALCMISSAFIVPVGAEGTVPDTGAPPVTTAAPDTGAPPETTAAPDTGAPPETSAAPDTGAPPETTAAPETSAPPETTAAPDTGAPPETSAPPVTPGTPGTGTAPVTPQPVVTAQTLIAMLFTYQGSDFLAQLELIKLTYPGLYGEVYAAAKEQVKAILIASAQMLYGSEFLAHLNSVSVSYPDLYAGVYTAVFGTITDEQLDSLYAVYAAAGALAEYYDLCATYRPANPYVFNNSLLVFLTDEQIAELYDLYALKFNLAAYYELCAVYRPNNAAFMYGGYLDAYLTGLRIDTVYAVVNTLTQRQLDSISEQMEAFDLKLLREQVVSSYLSARALVAWLYTQPTEVKQTVMNSLSSSSDPRLYELYMYTLTEEDCDAWFMLIAPDPVITETVYLLPIADFVTPSRRLSENTPSVKIYNSGLLYASPMRMTASSQGTTERATTLDGADKTAPVEGLNINKTVSYNSDGSYTIRLEAHTTGTVVTTPKPVDVVLVLDVSGSMDDDYAQAQTYQAVYGTRNGFIWSRYYGFYSTTSPQRYVKVNDTYFKVDYAGRDSGHFDYYHYNDGQQTVYLYPLLNSQTNIFGDRRQYNYPVVQFYEYRNTTISKLDALKSAASAFVDSVQSVVTSETDIRIGIVSYSSSSAIRSGLVKIDPNGSASGSLKVVINGLSANGATRMDLGMGTARDMLNAGDGRDKVVILFTDGSPTDYNGFQSSVANATITTANTLKNSYGATIYTISILPGSNPATPAANYLNDQRGSNGIINLSNQLMHLVSSNYKSPNDGFSGSISGSSSYIGSVSYNGPIGTRQNGNYYLAASNIGMLTAIFENLAHESVAPACALGENTVIKDLIAPQFSLPATGDITAYTSDYLGGGNFSSAETAITLMPTVNANGIVSISGFNFDANCCVNGSGSIPTSGKKLIIYIQVKPLDSFFGGNNVDTNPAAVIYSVGSDGKETPLKAFPKPQVNVALNYEVAAENQMIFYGEDADAAVMLALGDKYIPDGKNNSHVTITYTIKPEGSTEIIAAKTVPAGQSFGSVDWGKITGLLPGEHKYIVTAEVTPTGDGYDTSGSSLPGPRIQTSIDSTATATVNVLSGTITIEKNLADGTALENSKQRFIFNVTGPDGTTSYVLEANGSLTLTGLKKGAYTVTEDTEWSWRYKVDDNNGGTLSVGGKDDNGDYITDGGTITITNKLEITGWLSDEAHVVNAFTSTTSVVTTALLPTVLDELMKRFTV